MKKNKHLLFFDEKRLSDSPKIQPMKCEEFSQVLTDRLQENDSIISGLALVNVCVDIREREKKKKEKRADPLE